MSNRNFLVEVNAGAFVQSAGHPLTERWVAFVSDDGFTR